MRSFSEEPLRIESTKFKLLRLKGTRREKKLLGDLLPRGVGVDFVSPPPPPISGFTFVESKSEGRTIGIHPPSPHKVQLDRTGSPSLDGKHQTLEHKICPKFGRGGGQWVITDWDNILTLHFFVKASLSKALLTKC
jgi:hypothetical protein